MSDDFTAKNINVTYTYDENAFCLDINDGKTHTSILYADKYNSGCFDNNADICAFFTRKTKNQFNPEQDEMPDCGEFITRLKKGVSIDGITNTFGKKTITIKG